MVIYRLLIYDVIIETSMVQWSPDTRYGRVNPSLVRFCRMSKVLADYDTRHAKSNTGTVNIANYVVDPTQ